MALPVISRPWRFQVNQLIAGDSNALLSNQPIFRTMKNALLGLGAWTDSAGAAASIANNWTVVASSNGVTFGFDGVDRWNANSDLIWSVNAVSPHSWIVLRQTAIAPKFEVCFDLRSINASPDSYYWYVALSPSVGFGAANGGTNGTLSVRPTATDELVHSTVSAGNVNVNGGTSAGNTSTRLHVLRSADGRASRVILARNGFTTNMIFMEAIENAWSGWPGAGFYFGPTNPSNAGAPGSSSAAYSNISASASGMARFPGGPQCALQLTGEGTRTNVLNGERQTVANEISGENPMYPVGLYGVSGGAIGRHGTIADLWWGLGGFGEGTSYPAVAPLRQFVQAGCLIFPWNQSNPLFL